MKRMTWILRIGPQWLVGEDVGESSSDERNRLIHKRMVREDFKIILRFRKEDEQVHLSPLAVSREF